MILTLIEMHTFAIKRKYVHETLCPKEAFDPRSYRIVKSGKHLITIACPKGNYKAQVCIHGVKSQKILHPIHEFKNKYPTKYKKLINVGYGNPIKMNPTRTTIRTYCPP